jgi:hypothetical protein
MAEPLDSLQPFEIPVHTKTAIVNTSIINADVDAVARKELVDYHPKVDYEITAPIIGSGADAYLKIVPQGGPWSPEQRNLLEKLKFVPTPQAPVPGRARVLMMLRDPGGNIQLGATAWYLVNARIEKTTLSDGRVVNDVILVWEYRDKMNGIDYLKPVITSWKW